MERQHRAKAQYSLAPHQIAALRDAVIHHRASSDAPSDALIFLEKLLNVENICTIAVSVHHLDGGSAVVNEDTTLWVRRARKHDNKQEE